MVIGGDKPPAALVFNSEQNCIERWAFRIFVAQRRHKTSGRKGRKVHKRAILCRLERLKFGQEFISAMAEIRTVRSVYVRRRHKSSFPALLVVQNCESKICCDSEVDGEARPWLSDMLTSLVVLRSHQLNWHNWLQGRWGLILKRVTEQAVIFHAWKSEMVKLVRMSPSTCTTDTLLKWNFFIPQTGGCSTDFKNILFFFTVFCQITVKKSAFLKKNVLSLPPTAFKQTFVDLAFFFRNLQNPATRIYRSSHPCRCSDRLCVFNAGCKTVGQLLETKPKISPGNSERIPLPVKRPSWKHRYEIRQRKSPNQTRGKKTKSHWYSLNCPPAKSEMKQQTKGTLATKVEWMILHCTHESVIVVNQTSLVDESCFHLQMAKECSQNLIHVFLVVFLWIVSRAKQQSTRCTRTSALCAN